MTLETAWATVWALGWYGIGLGGAIVLMTGRQWGLVTAMGGAVLVVIAYFGRRRGER